MMKKIFANFILLLLCFSLCTTNAYAFTGFTKDTREIAESFAYEYGWELEKTGEKSWTDDEGNKYKRTVGHQKDYFNDLYTTSEEHCLELGIISPMAAGGAGGAGIVEIALQEYDLGVQEEPLGSNIVKYNEWYYGKNVGGPDYPWCVAFVAWCANECELLGEDKPFLKTAGCAQMRDHFRNQGFDEYSILGDCEPLGGSGYTPVPGDILFFSGYSHIGIIVDVQSDSITTVEGNASDMVVKREIHKGALSGQIAGGTIFHVVYPEDCWTVFYFLTDPAGMNLSEATAAGICANIEHESNFRPSAYGDLNCGGSLGICQWHLSREQNLRNFCDQEGYDPESMEGQLHFLQWELEGPFDYVLYDISNVSDDADGAYEAGAIWCEKFEVPAEYWIKKIDRGNLARDKYYPMFEGKKRDNSSDSNKPHRPTPGSGTSVGGDGHIKVT